MTRRLRHAGRTCHPLVKILNKKISNQKKMSWIKKKKRRSGHGHEAGRVQQRRKVVFVIVTLKLSAAQSISDVKWRSTAAGIFP